LNRASAASGIPASLIAAIAYLESWGDSDALSPAGPKGIMQFSEATARAAGLRVVRVTRFKITTERKLVRRKNHNPVYRTVRHRTPYTVTVRDDRLNPERAIPAAANYLARLENKFGGRDWAVFAYHCGEGCIAELQPLAEAALGHKRQPTVASMFFAASPAFHRDLYEALQRHMQRDYSPTYWFRVMRAEQLLNLYREDRDVFRDLVAQYRNPNNPARRANDRLLIWLKSEDTFYQSGADLDESKDLVQAFDDPKTFGFALPPHRAEDPYLRDSRAALGTLLYIAYETRRLFELRQLIPRHSELAAEDFLGVLAEVRRRPPQRPLDLPVLRGRTWHRQLAHPRLFERHEEFALREMVAFVHLPHRVDRSEGDPRLLRRLVQVGDLPPGYPLAHQRLQRVHVLCARDAILEDILAGPLGIAHQLDQALPLMLFDREDEDLAVLAVGEEPRAERARAQA
jgi:hypothetical protein